MSNGSERTPERTWLQPGDRVRLTGEDWIHLGMHGQTVRVVDIDVDGDALIEDPNGGMLAVFSDPRDGDYSAERVEGDSEGLEVWSDPFSDFVDPRPTVRVGGDNFDGLRSRIAALEAVIRLASEEAAKKSAGRLDIARILDLAPSVVLDGMIREAKAEALEAAASPTGGYREWVEKRIRAGSIEWPVWLRERAAAYRNGDA